MKNYKFWLGLILFATPIMIVLTKIGIQLHLSHQLLDFLSFMLIWLGGVGITLYGMQLMIDNPRS